MLLASTIRPSQTISSASEKETLTTSMNSSRVSGEFARLKIRRDEEPDHLVRKTGCGIYKRVRAIICDARIPAQPNYPPLVHDLAVDPSRHVRTQTASSTVTVPHPSPSSGPWTSSASPPTTTVISSGRIQLRAASQASSSVTLRIRSR